MNDDKNNLAAAAGQNHPLKEEAILNFLNKNNMRQEKGFTLIELLVVIAIIGLLSSIVLVSLNSARMKARDARRKADLHSLVTALDLYSDDLGGLPLSNQCGAGSRPPKLFSSSSFCLTT